METTIYREITNEFHRPCYTFVTIKKWQKVWLALCDMAYTPGAQTYERIIVRSDLSDKQDAMLYSLKMATNQDLITFEHVWKKFDKYQLLVCNELKELYVPKVLFECLGVKYLLQTSFPNCEVKFWED